MSFYSYSYEELAERSPFPVKLVPDCPALDRLAARKIANVLRANNEAGRETAIILPVGPLQYEPLADLVNQEAISLKGLTFFMMDEFLDDNDAPVADEHPMSFRRFMVSSFTSRVDPALGFSEDRVVFPFPDRAAEITRRVLERGGADLCFAGVGISGHLAFNDPPEPHEKDKGIDWVRSCTTRPVTLARESRTQLVLGGTHGDWSLIPHRACTLGMKELLASKKIIVFAMRPWHQGTTRRTMFGPVEAAWPASLLQEHPDVEFILTDQAAHAPAVNVTCDTGEEAETPA